MKSKIIFFLLAFLLPQLLVQSAGEKEKGSEVVITPHEKACILPAPTGINQQTALTFTDIITDGSVAWGNDLQHSNLYNFNLDDPTAISIVSTVPYAALAGDCEFSEPLYMWIIDHSDQYLKKMELATSIVIDSVPIPCPLVDGLWSCLAIHKTTNQFFSVATNGLNSVLYEIDPLSGEVSEIIQMDIVAVISGSFDMAGMLYLFDIETDMIFVVDVFSQTTAMLGPAGFDGNYAQGMGLDPATNEVYLAAYVDGVGAQLRILDKATGNTTLVSELPGETGAFAIPYHPDDEFIMAGMDEWISPGAEISFGDNGDLPSIPLDFFFPGSEPFEGMIEFQGENSQGGQEPASDVTISRIEDGEFVPPNTQVEIPVEIVEMNLKSDEPIVVGDSFFDVFFQIDFSNQQSGISIITKVDEYGGTFTTQLMFFPVITFVEVGNPNNTRIFTSENSLMFYGQESYNWTFNPIPNDFDPIGDVPLILSTEMGGYLEILPFLSRNDFAYLAMNEEGIAESWEGSGYNNGEWYEYPNYGWWNVWLYDHPYDNARKKIINATFDIQPYNPEFPVDVTIVYNWSTGNWQGWPEVPRPPLPGDVPTPEIEDEIIGRSEPVYNFQGTIGAREVITDNFVIEGFNPEWLSIDVMGSNFVLNATVNHVCFKEYTPPVIEGGILKVGDWMVSEDWHRWIGNDKEETKVEFYPEMHDGILQVYFYYSIAGTGEWIQFDTDDNGQSGVAPGPMPEETEDMDGWSGYLDHSLLPAQNAELDFRAQVFTADSFFDVFTELSVEWDVTPPSSVTTNLYDFIITEEPYILLEVLPENANISFLEIEVEPKPEYFEKGIPSAIQPGDMDCGPTALAACLKYFEANGHPDVTGGYNLADLIEWLKIYCKTDPETGTWDTDLEKGVREWIEENGGGFSVRRIRFDWQTMRNELERCQDIITLFNWKDANGNWQGHFMTFNSVSNIPEPDGRIKFDFMDPWTGENIDGYVNPETGEVDGLTDSEGNYIVPDGAEIFSTVIICPEESSINPGTGTIIPGPYPQPFPIPLDTAGMYWIRIQIIDDDGNKSRLDYPIEYVSSAQEPEDMVLAPDNKTNPDPWHAWISDLNESTPVSLLAYDPDDQIAFVDFYYALNPDFSDASWFYTDHSGLSNEAPGDAVYDEGADGWRGYFSHAVLSNTLQSLYFKAILTSKAGYSYDVEANHALLFDPTPPSSVSISPGEEYFTLEESVTFDVDPVDANIDVVVFQNTGVLPTVYDKDFPILTQPNNYTCGPTAMAMCLKYFAQANPDQYGAITGGLSDAALIDSLSKYLGTTVKGTTEAGMLAGIERWIRNHGGGFNATAAQPFSDFGIDELYSHLVTDGITRGVSQDMISMFEQIQWIGDSCVKTYHYMTLSSAHESGNSSGRRFDYCDPSFGEKVYFDVDENGVTSNYTDVEGNELILPYDTVRFRSTLMICPNEPSSIPSGGTVAEGPDPPPVEQPLPEPGNTTTRVRVVDEDGNSHDTDVPVNRVPPTTYYPLDTIVPVGSSPIPLQGGIPQGGLYSGNHVNDNWFFPDEPGVFLIVYTVTYPEFTSSVDFTITVIADFGDAPQTYPTLLANGGAWHFLGGQAFLGSLIDGEPDGQPNINATGDDLNNLADEDGISFGQIISGSPAQITVTTSVAGFLQGWMDFNGDGDWNDANEQIFTDEYIHFPSTVCLNYMIPADAIEGTTYARFRFATFSGLPYFGSADNGEVEDYKVNIIHDQGIKWQQDPCPENSGLHCHDQIILGEYYYTFCADDWLCQGGLVTDIHWWGNYENQGSGINYFHLSIHNNDPTSCLPVTSEIWGIDVPIDMTNETNTGMLNSENGFIYSYEYYLDFPFDQVAGQTYWLDICAYSVEPGNPAIWRWQESDRSTVPILCTAATMSISNPWSSVYWTTPQPTRYSDMAFIITSSDDPPVNLDFGDAPDDPYPTLLASDGARHVNDGITYLGNLIDTEPDGQPNAAATGDDLNNLQDEDGVVFRTQFVQGKPATIKVLASVDGILNTWIDYNRNGSWADGGDYIFVNQNLVAGWNTLIINVPASAAVGKTYIRFRFDTQGGLNYYGAAENGEVEDYLINIFPEAWGYIPTPITHTILVPLNVALLGTSLSPNDVIGVFCDDFGGNEICGGAEIWDGVNNQVVLAYGDDNTTPLIKEGFAAGDEFIWKIHHTATGIDEYVVVTYNPAMPQTDGKFTDYGLSGLTQIGGLSVTASATPTSVCAGDVVQLDVVVTGGSGTYTYAWTSNPPGFTSIIKNPTDTPSADITYMVQVTDGSVTVSSQVDVEVQAVPVADAGFDITVCEDNTVLQLNGSAANYSALFWTSAGDGVFDDPTVENPYYTLGPLDIASGMVVLTFEVSPELPCAISVNDEMLIAITNNPVADAGADATICMGETYTLAGQALNYSSIAWTTSGDGVFDDNLILDATYTPGDDDKQQGEVVLLLTALPIGPCTAAYTDIMTLYIRETQTVHLFEGWNGLSSYLTPYNSNDNFDLFDPIINTMVIAYNFSGTFWPGNTNTLTWVDTSGYVIKMNVDDDMFFCGDEINNKVVNLEQDWNVIPVLNKSSVLVEDVFINQTEFKIVMEVAGWKMYWPQYGINSLLTLDPGKAYFAYMNMAASIDFGGLPVKSGNISEPIQTNITPWNDVIHTPGNHVVAFASKACSNFEAGDVIGGFTTAGLCAGITTFTGTSAGLGLQGDDVLSTYTEGFESNEFISFKLYRPSTGQLFNLRVNYDENLEHSGMFHNYSMSAITDLKLSPVGISDPAFGGIIIYPNPSHGTFNIEGIDGKVEITIFNAFGKEVLYKELISPTQVDLTGQPGGVYFIRLSSDKGSYFGKLIVN